MPFDKNVGCLKLSLYRLHNVLSQVISKDAVSEVCSQLLLELSAGRQGKEKPEGESVLKHLRDNALLSDGECESFARILRKQEKPKDTGVLEHNLPYAFDEYEGALIIPSLRHENYA